MIDSCPMCFEKLMPMMLFEDGFMCDMCGAYAENLTKEDIIELQNLINQHKSAQPGA